MMGVRGDFILTASATQISRLMRAHEAATPPHHISADAPGRASEADDNAAGRRMGMAPAPPRDITLMARRIDVLPTTLPYMLRAAASIIEADYQAIHAALGDVPPPA